MSLRLLVECYAGYKADERPLRFSFAVPSEATGTAPALRNYEVKEVLDQWYGPDYQCFKVVAEDGNLYILRHNQAADTWALESFRRGPETRARKVQS